jgi:hypothetical protein
MQGLFKNSEYYWTSWSGTVLNLIVFFLDNTIVLKHRSKSNSSKSLLINELIYSSSNNCFVIILDTTIDV